MSSKSLIYIFMVIGSSLGGFIPTLWGADAFSISSVLFGAIGGFLGIYVGFKISRS